MNERKADGIFIGNAIIASIAAFLVFFPQLSSMLGVRETQALLLIYLGALFIASYFFENRSFIFRFFMGICLYVSWPAKRETAFLYAALLVGFGVAGLFGFLGKAV